MAYTKRTWEDRTVERPLTYTLQTNADGTTTLIPSEGSIITTGTPITAANLNNMENGIEDVDTRLTTAEGTITSHGTRITDVEADMTTVWGELFTNPYEIPRTHIDYDGALIMQRASDKLYGTNVANANFLIGVQDTQHAHNYIIGVGHYQNNSYFVFTKLAGNVLTYVTNTLGTISVTGGVGPYKFTVIGIGGLA
jgi:hypothetical protein